MPRLAIIACLLFNFPSYGIENKEVNTKRAMQSVLDSYIKLIPFIYSPTEETPNKKERKRISNYIYQMHTAFKQAEHGKILKYSNISPLRRNIENELIDIADTYNLNNYLYSKYRLRSFASNCIQCHSQLPPKSYKRIRNKKTLDAKRQLATHFEKGIFLYLLRDYKNAINEFQSEIDLRLKQRKYRTSVENSFQNILSIYTKVLKKPKDAIIFLKPYQSRKYIYQSIPTMLKNWITSLEKWKEKEYLTASINNDEAMINFLKDVIPSLSKSPIVYSDSTLTVDQLFISGIISNYLIKKPKTKLRPRLLYHLGAIESNLSNQVSHSLGDLYLKECIISFPRSNYANKCLSIYKDNIKLYFTGSSGTDIPKEVQEEIRELTKLISK